MTPEAFEALLDKVVAFQSVDMYAVARVLALMKRI